MKLTIEQKQFLKRNNLTLKQVGDFFGIVNINKSRKSKAKYINALIAFENHIKVKKEGRCHTNREWLVLIDIYKKGRKGFIINDNLEIFKGEKFIARVQKHYDNTFNFFIPESLPLNSWI